jgi:aminoglycoside phosphotransferase (APT) family kinase protein
LSKRPLRKLGEGREAEVFELSPEEVLRVLRDPLAVDKTQMEALALRAARDAGCAVPWVGETTTHEGRPALVMQRAQGPDLLTQIEKRPWSFLSIAGMLSNIHAEIHRVKAPPGIPNLKDQLRVRILGCDQLPSELKEFALGLLQSMPDGDRLCHGDFHPGNVLADPSGPLVIDWINVTCGDPVADIARTKLLLRIGTPPDMSVLLRAIISLGRRMMMRRYLDNYRKHAALPAEALEKWETVHTAARMAEEIPGEAPKLIDLLRRARAQRVP